LLETFELILISAVKVVASFSRGCVMSHFRMRGNVTCMEAWQKRIGWIFLPLKSVFSPSIGLYFAAEDEGRTEEPTERRREKEREKGRVPKSPEIPSSLVALGGLVVLFLAGGFMLSGMIGMIRRFVGNFSILSTISETEMIPLLLSVSAQTALLMLPLLLVVTIMGIVGNVVQTGLMFTLKPLEPDFNRIALTWDNMMKRVFFSRQVAVNLVKTILKLALLGWVSYIIIMHDYLNVMKTGEMGVGESLRLISFLSFKLALILTLILFFLSLPDYLYQRYEFTESIKMTKQDIKQEYRESDGDPLVKQRQRRMAHDLLRRNMLQKVPEANVVITNPTHYAVAVRYIEGVDNGPIVVAKGEDNLALLIRSIAKRNEIPIVENKALARELYARVNVDQSIPEQFYTALAAIFKEIMGARV